VEGLGDGKAGFEVAELGAGHAAGGEVVLEFLQDDRAGNRRWEDWPENPTHADLQDELRETKEKWLLTNPKPLTTNAARQKRKAAIRRRAELVRDLPPLGFRRGSVT